MVAYPHVRELRQRAAGEDTEEGLASTACSIVSRLLDTKTHGVAPLLRSAAKLAYHRRWWGFVSVALQRTVATSLLDHPGLGCMPGMGPAPPLGDVFHEAIDPVAFSRMPMRG